MYLQYKEKCRIQCLNSMTNTQLITEENQVVVSHLDGKASTDSAMLNKRDPQRLGKKQPPVIRSPSPSQMSNRECPPERKPRNQSIHRPVQLQTPLFNASRAGETLINHCKKTPEGDLLEKQGCMFTESVPKDGELPADELHQFADSLKTTDAKLINKQSLLNDTGSVRERLADEKINTVSVKSISEQCSNYNHCSTCLKSTSSGCLFAKSGDSLKYGSAELKTNGSLVQPHVTNSLNITHSRLVTQSINISNTNSKEGNSGNNIDIKRIASDQLCNIDGNSQLNTRTDIVVSCKRNRETPGLLSNLDKPQSDVNKTNASVTVNINTNVKTTSLSSQSNHENASQLEISLNNLQTESDSNPIKFKDVRAAGVTSSSPRAEPDVWENVIPPLNPFNKDIASDQACIEEDRSNTVSGNSFPLIESTIDSSSAIGLNVLDLSEKSLCDTEQQGKIPGGRVENQPVVTKAIVDRTNQSSNWNNVTLDTCGTEDTLTDINRKGKKSIVTSGTKNGNLLAESRHGDSLIVQDGLISSQADKQSLSSIQMQNHGTNQPTYGQTGKLHVNTSYKGIIPKINVTSDNKDGDGCVIGTGGVDRGGMPDLPSGLRSRQWRHPEASNMDLFGSSRRDSESRPRLFMHRRSKNIWIRMPNGETFEGKFHRYRT